MCPQHLSATRNCRHAFGEGRDELVKARRRPLDDRDTADRQTHMRIGVFNLQESGIEGCQMLHLATVRPRARRNQSQKSSTSGAKRKLCRRRTSHIVSKMMAEQLDGEATALPDNAR